MSATYLEVSKQFIIYQTDDVISLQQGLSKYERVRILGGDENGIIIDGNGGAEALELSKLELLLVQIGKDEYLKRSPPTRSPMKPCIYAEPAFMFEIESRYKVVRDDNTGHGVVLRADLFSEEVKTHPPIYEKTLIAVSVNDPRVIQFNATETDTVVTISYLPQGASTDPNGQSENNPYYLQQEPERAAGWLELVGYRYKAGR